jgi:hypothetical protein
MNRRRPRLPGPTRSSSRPRSSGRPRCRADLVEWRTIDLDWLRSQGVAVDVLEVYRTFLDSRLAGLEASQGGDHHVLIVDREIKGTYPSLEEAAKLVARDYAGRKVFVKKITTMEPVHSLGGATLKLPSATGNGR